MWQWWSAKKPEAVSLDEQLHRVAPSDLHQLSVEDVQACRRSASAEDLEAAMQLMLEDNRFVDVIACSTSPVWREASRGVTESQADSVGHLLRSRMSLLYSVLPYVSEEFLDVMAVKTPLGRSRHYAMNTDE